MSYVANSTWNIMNATTAITACVTAAACLACTPAARMATPGTVDPRLDVQLVTDQADAVLGILQLRAGGSQPTDADWSRLFATEGYRRLQQREHAMQRPFDDTTFRAFASSDTLLMRAGTLRRTLAAWRRVDPQRAAARAFRYLPDHTVLRARIYPVIKPLSNSFVFETRTNPAIFMYLDPTLDGEQFDNTLAHELHHVGVANACQEAAADPASSSGVGMALAWLGGFAEGRAMLAAAGSAHVHPHTASHPAERAVWDRYLARAGEDLQRLEAFLLDVIDGKLSDEEMNARGFTFVVTDSVPQGPFYTLGWLMSATIERELGRDRLVESTCDARMFIADYERAALAINARPGGINGRSGRPSLARGLTLPLDSLPLWSDELLRRLEISR